MTIDIEKLQRISTYARHKSVSVVAVSKWIAKGKIESVEIDGMKFVKTK